MGGPVFCGMLEEKVHKLQLECGEQCSDWAIYSSYQLIIERGSYNKPVGEGGNK